MKAKLYFAKLMECKTEDEFYEFFESMMYDLVKDAENLIKTRNAKRDESIKSCVMEVDSKWKAIVRLFNKYKSESLDDDFKNNIKLLDDGFKAIYVELHPEHKWVFDIEKHKKMIKELEEENERQKNAIDNLFLHKVTPFEDLTMDNITSEILACLASLGSFTNIIDGKHITINAVRPLAYRIALLRWWKHNGKINLDDVKDWESDPEKWAQNHFV